MLQDGDVLFPTDANDKTVYSNTSYLGAWKGMEKCVDLGLTKSIGVSNFNKRQVDDILKVAKIKPVTNQVSAVVPWKGGKQTISILS